MTSLTVGYWTKNVEFKETEEIMDNINHWSVLPVLIELHMFTNSTFYLFSYYLFICHSEARVRKIHLYGMEYVGFTVPRQVSTAQKSELP